MNRRIGIFSLESDIHGRSVHYVLKQKVLAESFLFFTDSQISNGGVIWRNGSAVRSMLRTTDGQWVTPTDLDVVWWRRVNFPQRDAAQYGEAAEYVSNEWKSAMSGAMLDGFGVIWVNKPHLDAIASNKLFQLSVAEACGFRVPRTLISQDPLSVRQFMPASNGDLIIKKLAGTAGHPLATVQITEPQLDDDAIAICPAIYQERIRGNRHLRAHCFGNKVHTVMIESEVLDWRRDLSCPFAPYTVDAHLERSLTAIVRHLGLEMAIMDLMITEHDDLVWIELNPQGQFLFAEGLSGYDLTTPFTECLADVAERNERTESKMSGVFA